MTRLHFFKNIVATLLTLLFVPGLTTWALAQGDDELVVTITQVDSQAFPQVTAHVTVSDADGWLLAGLAAANFQILEDDTQVPISSVDVELDDDSQGISIVLALDVSMPDETLTMIREDIKSFVGALGPQDRVAIVTFSNEVQVAQEFSTDKEELWAAIDALEPGGTLTALNEAVFEAATMVGTLVADRRMVIVLTDSKDNSATLSSTDAVSRAIESEVPIYIIGFGTKVESKVLTDMAQQTGGQARIFSDPDGVRTSLQTLEGMSQPGYQVTFQSELKVDDAEHELSIRVTYMGEVGQSQARFVAVPGKVTVTLSDIVDGQMVGGIVSLVVDVTAPTSIASVEYSLDGKLLIKQYAPAAAASSPAAATSDSYSFDWDSTTVDPGVYTLTVGAIDSAGNVGYAQAHLNVVLPVVVSVSTSQQEIELGNEVIVEAQVDALADIVGVEFLLDGQSLGIVNNSPYRFSFDSSDHLAGDHTITVRAKDSLDRENSDSLSLQFLAPPEPPSKPGWLSYVKTAFIIIVAVIAAVAGIAVAVMVLVAVSKWQRKKYQTICHLEIQNLGNVPSQYQLLVEEPAGALVFQFVLNGVNLGQQQVTQVAGRAVEEPGQDRRGVTRAKRADQAALFVSLKEKAQKTSSRAKGVNQAIVGVLAAIASLLPRSAGAPLRSLTSRMRQQQTAVGRLGQTPRQMRGNLRQVRRQTTQVKRTASPTRATSSPSQITDHRVTVTQTVVDTWVQTPSVEPGETLIVDLLVDPIEPPRQTQHYPIAVTSRSVEQEDAPQIVEKGNVQIEGVSRFYRLLPLLIFVAVIAIQALLIGLWLRSTGVLG